MRIAPGTILMSVDTHLPSGVRITREAYSRGWVAIKGLDPRGFDRQLRDAGWSIHSLEASLEMGALGFGSEGRFDRACRVRFARC